MKLAPWLHVPPREEHAIAEALARRRQLPSDERRTFPPPQVTQVSRGAALLWVLRVLRQDNPVLLYVGLAAVATNLLYLVASGIAALVR